jgi:predicted nucleotidyltransferase
MINITPLTDEQIKNNIIKIISKNLPKSKIILFGSRAKTENTNTSDYDIAIETGQKIPADILDTIKESIEKLATLKKIDLVDFYLLSDNFKQIVLAEGQVIYETD